MTGRELVRRAIRFEKPDRLPRAFPEPYGSDFWPTGMDPSVDARPGKGIDEWGVVWDNIGESSLGQVKDFPLKDYDELDKLHIPDINDPRRWEALGDARRQAGDKFVLAQGISLYERVYFIRGMENTWADICDVPDKLGGLIDILVDMNLTAIGKFAAAGADGVIWCDDWGLQDRLMISPEAWRNIWKPRYAKLYQAAHRAGMATFLHSCGYIVEIMDDLIEIGLDVIQMDQQENMGLELLGDRFGGRVTFWCPVDIQRVMPRGDLDEIRSYCRKMVKCLSRPAGGFMATWYSDPVGAGHSRQAIEAMCEEFIRIGGA